MKIKSSDLTGKALDWAVAKAVWTLNNGAQFEIPISVFMADYSTNAAITVPIIEREDISILNRAITNPDLPKWFAVSRDAIQLALDEDGDTDAAIGCTGPTFLIAGTRCFVVIVLGDEVDVADELFQNADERALAI